MRFPPVSGQAVLSPMAGVTDVAFRALAKQWGAAVTYTEFISSTAIVRGNEKTKELLVVDKSEKPVAVQLFGSSVQDVVDAAKFVEDRFDIVDINCGCPAWKVVKTGAGSALLNDPEKIHSFVSKLVSAVNIPVTVKIRIGTHPTKINAVEVAKTIEDAGAAAVAVHGRTRHQGYSGTADWSVIKQVKESVDIPVIGNGDVFTPEDFKEKLEYSGVDMIMVARGAMKNPFIFKQIQDFMKTGTYETMNGLEQFNCLLPFAEKHSLPFSLIKSHAIQFTKGMEGGAKLRDRLVKSKNIEALKEVVATS